MPKKRTSKSRRTGKPKRQHKKHKHHVRRAIKRRHVVRKAVKKPTRIRKVPRKHARSAAKHVIPEKVDIETPLDKLYEFVRNGNDVSLAEAKKKLGIRKEKILTYAKILKMKGLIDIKYRLFGAPRLVLKRVDISSYVGEIKGNVIDSYETASDNLHARIDIKREEGGVVPTYNIKPPKIGTGTKGFLDFVTEELGKEVNLGTEEIIDPKKIEKLKKVFFDKAYDKIVHYLDISTVNAKALAGMLVQRIYGLGEIDIILSDKYLEEIAINNSNEPVVIYHKKYGWLRTAKRLESEEEIYNLASMIGRKVQRDITNLKPIMDAHLLTGDRVSATLFPISTMGNTITIRKFSRVPWTITNLCSGESKTISVELAAFLWQALEYELNIMVAGGTASGKTSMLSAICALMPPTQRIISIEDTREISLPDYLHWNWVPMTTRNPNPEGQGEINMLDLIVASLRMRPDRIIVGEVRTKKQAETMFEAMHTGHSVYTTIHADTAEQVKRRLLEPPIAIPKNELEALQLILIQYRDRRRNLRRTLELTEILKAEGGDLKLNYLYRWNPRNDGFEKINDSIRVVEDLNMHTGMTLNEINQDLKEREAVLKWMIKKKVTDIEKLGKAIKKYYEDRNSVVSACINNKKINDIFG
jgi:flagellar protein FlaI